MYRFFSMACRLICNINIVKNMLGDKSPSKVSATDIPSFKGPIQYIPIQTIAQI